jgi:hypothetical protein
LDNLCPALGLDPYLQGVGYTTCVRILTGFAAHVHQGVYGRGKRVQAGTVVGALTAIGQEIAMACGKNPTKITGSERILPRLQQTYDEWRKEDSPTTKQLPIKADIPELLVKRGRSALATELDQAIGNLTLIGFYYLLRIGEYTVKGSRNDTKQTVQFKFEDITFFQKECSGTASLSPSTSSGTPHNHGRWGNAKIGKPEEWVERGMCLPRSKWQGTPLSGSCPRMPVPLSSKSWS